MHDVRLNKMQFDLYRMVDGRLQKPLWRFIQLGMVPFKCPELVATLAGRLQSGRDAPPPNNHPRLHDDGVLNFLDKYAADLDIAHGSYGYVLRWQRHGGLNGRVPR